MENNREKPFIDKCAEALSSEKPTFEYARQILLEAIEYSQKKKEGERFIFCESQIC